MIELKGNIWDQEADIILITTNGTVKANGRAVMGKGCALEAKKKYKGIDQILGEVIIGVGNYPTVLINFSKPKIVSFPTKHNWWEKSDIDLIEQSCKELKEWIDCTTYKKIVLPRPGCGNGQLSWDVVKPILEKYFDDRFIVCSK